MDFYAYLCFPRPGESFPLKIVLKKERKDFKNNFGCEGTLAEEVRKCSSQFPPQFHINKLIPMNSRHQITRKIYQKQVNS